MQEIKLRQRTWLERLIRAPLVSTSTPDRQGRPQIAAVHRAPSSGVRAKTALAKTATDEDAPPDEAERRKRERALLAILTAAYAAQRDRIQQMLRDAGENVQAGMLDQMFMSETAAILRDVLPAYDETTSAAAVAGLDQLTIGVDWDQVNTAVLRLAQTKRGALLRRARPLARRRRRKSSPTG
jgi:hypothetical protein